MNIKGETIQNGEPTPEHPVDIENKINILLAVDDENNSEKEYKLPFLTNIEQQAIETVLSELEKKDKRLNRQFKLFQKKDKEIEELKADNSHQWEERCKLTFELEKKDEYIKMLTDERDTLIQERDYYKARYNEFNNAFIEGGKK